MMHCKRRRNILQQWKKREEEAALSKATHDRDLESSDAAGQA